MQKEIPWQLRMFQKTLKKRQRLQHLIELLGTIQPETKCLLVTCGDNNGAINFKLREIGGTWSWADAESAGIDEMSDLLGDVVSRVDPASMPYDNCYFDVVISIDVHEHIHEPETYTRELSRITRPNGKIIITVPGGNSSKVVNRMKKWLGMTKRQYGHVTDGYSVEQVEALMREASVHPEESKTFSKFFTELIELALNFTYVNILGKRGKTNVEEGTIAPQTKDQLQSVRKSYRAYAAVYPIVRLISSLDRALPFLDGYVVIVMGQKR